MNRTTINFILSSTKLIMKRLLLFLPFLLGALSISAQYDIVELQYPVKAVKAGAVGPDGYYLLAYHKEKRTEDNVIRRYYTPELVHVNFNMEVQWRKRFPVAMFHSLTSIQVDDNSIYLGGTDHNTGNEKSNGWVVCIDQSGNKKWEKRFSYPNYHTVEGREVILTPDGDLLFTGHAYRNFNSYGSPVIYRLNKYGDVVWKSLYGTKYTLPHFNHGTFTQDGNLIFGGHVYPDNQSLRVSNTPRAWVAKINLATGALMWDRYHKISSKSFLYAFSEAENGKLLGIGHANDDILVTKLSAIGELQDSETTGTCDKSHLRFIYKNPQTGISYAVGECIDERSNPKHLETVLAIFDQNLKEIDRLTIDAN